MTLRQRLDSDLKEALRKGDTLRRDVLRLARNAIQYEETAKARPLEESEVVVALQRQVKLRRESIEEFRKGRRQDLLEREEAELGVLQEYLPQQMGQEEIAAEARAAMQEVGARGPADKGRVMGRLMLKVRGKADGAEVNAVVTELLESLAKG